jgi:hypothetical protein
VSVELALLVPGVIVAGEKEQLNVLGMPLQLSAIGLFNDPDCSFAVTVRLPAIPAGIVRDAGVALNDRVRVGAGVGAGVGGGGGVGWGATHVAV